MLKLLILVNWYRTAVRIVLDYIATTRQENVCFVSRSTLTINQIVISDQILIER